MAYDVLSPSQSRYERALPYPCYPHYGNDNVPIITSGIWLFTRHLEQRVFGFEVVKASKWAKCYAERFRGRGQVRLE